MRRKSTEKHRYTIDGGDTSGSTITVAVRIRGLSGKEIETGHLSCCEAFGNNIVITKNGDVNGYLKSQMTSFNEYSFDHVYSKDSTQYEVYEGTTKPFIPHLLKGYNVTVFAYGATGAGLILYFEFDIILIQNLITFTYIYYRKDAHNAWR